MKIIFVILLLIVALLVGCVPSVTVVTGKDVLAAGTPTPSSAIITMNPLPTPDTNIVRKYEKGYDANFSPKSGVGTRIVTIDIQQSGIKFAIPFPILCGDDSDRKIRYELRIPRTEELEKCPNGLPLEYFSWFSNTEGTLVVKAGQHTEAYIEVVIPQNAVMISGAYELRASVMDVTNPSNVFIAPEVAWVINISV